MKHRIETTVDTVNEAAKVLKAVLNRVGLETFESAVETENDPETGCMVVIVTGNGATLRDVIFALDVAGALD